MTRAERVIAFIERYCRAPEGAHVGQPLKLCHFQRQFILDIYDNPAGTRRAYLSVARKNGKSALIAALLLAHLVGPEAVLNSQIVSGAMSREQAAVIFALADKMVTLNSELRAVIKTIPSSKKLIGLPRSVEYRALSAEAKTAHGLSPVLAVLDEIGQVRGPRSDFVDAITTAQGAHESPLLLVISTQAATDADLFSIWLDDARKSKDPRIVSHVYCADEEADVLDESAWRAANPALGEFRSIDDLREQARQASRMPSAENSFRNLCLNQRISVVNPYMSRSVWESCGASVEPFDPDVEHWAGLDLSAKRDLTALVVVQKHGDDWHVYPYFWTPGDGLLDRAKRDAQPYDVWVEQGFLRTTPGATVDYDFVAHDMCELLSPACVGIAFDRWRIDIMMKAMEAAGLDLPMHPWGQGFRDMTPALEALEEQALNGRLAHGMHPVLTMCAANAVESRDPAGGRKLDKHKATGRIDGMIALAMALGLTQKVAVDLGAVSVYETRGIIELEV